MYRLNNHLTDLGWVEFDYHVPPILPRSSLILPNTPLPQQLGFGNSKIKVNPTQVRELGDGSPCIE